MKFLKHCSVAMFFAATVANAQDTGYWKAVSKTATSVTGDIQISADRLVIGFTPYTIAQIRALTPAEVPAVFDVAADQPVQGTANLYRLNISAAKRFMHKNTLCGSEDTTYLVTYVSGRDLQVAFFSGAAIPDLKPGTVGNSTALCGTYSYRR